MYTVYKHTNTKTSKSYIGYTKHSTSKRWKAHLSKVAEGSKSYFHNSIRKHGVGVWKSCVIVDCIPTEGEAKLLEIFHIKAEGTFGGGYNLTFGGDGGGGVQPKGELSPSYGKKHSKETVIKRTESNTGKKRSKESKANISKGIREARDTKLYNFYNPSTGTVETDICVVDLLKKYNMNTNCAEMYAIANMGSSARKANGTSYSCKGWFVFSEFLGEIVVDNTYTFHNRYNNTTLMGASVKYMKSVYGGGNKFLKLASGAIKTTKDGWELL